jgi:hypothetical protein
MEYFLEKSDLFSGEKFKTTRIDQYFANRQNQIRYNNFKARLKRQAMRSVNSPLNKNREILLVLLGSKKEIILSRDFLKGAGYNLNYFSHSVKLENKEHAAGVYEFCIQKINETTFKIWK